MDNLRITMNRGVVVVDKLHVRMRSARAGKGLTQVDVAKRMAISVDVYRGYESGRSVPSLARLVAIADALDVSIAWLLGESDVM